MTREEAIERLKNYTQYRCGGVDLIAINMAIQAIEQEPINDVLNKISAEIEEIQTYDGIYIDRAYVLEIIDKYKEVEE